MFATKIDRVIDPVSSETLASVEELMLLDNPNVGKLEDRKFAAAVYVAYHAFTGTRDERPDLTE
jgi:hypothetical protein